MKSKSWLDLIETSTLAKLVSYLAVDEAHCIPQRGTEFRPAYREVPAIFSAPKCHTPAIAVSATLTASDELDVKRSLRFDSDALIITSVI